MNHEFSYYVAAFLAAIGISMAVYLALAVLRYVVQDTFEVLIGNIIIPLVKLVFAPVLMFKRQADFNRMPVQETPKNRRVAPVESRKAAKRVSVGEELMDIPAYARKAKEVGYPMTKELLSKTKVVNNQNSKTKSISTEPVMA